MESNPSKREGVRTAGMRACVYLFAHMQSMCVCLSEQKMAVLRPGRSCEYGKPIGLADYHKICPTTSGRHSDSHVFG